jgi:hypothetical protein
MKSFEVINIDDFDENYDIYQKLYRAREYITANKTDVYGYLLESDKIEYVYMDGSGPASLERRTSKPITSFRPAVSMDRGGLMLYNVDLYYGSSSPIVRKHAIYPVYEPMAWVYCDANTFDRETFRCKFTPFDVRTAQTIESKYALGDGDIDYRVKVGNSYVNYTLRQNDNEGELFIQTRKDDTARQRQVLRITNKEARELTAKRDIMTAISKLPQKSLLEISIKDNLDVQKIDELITNGTYKSKNYSLLLDQKDIFDQEYGNLTRADAYFILHHYNALQSGIIIDFD